MGQSVRPLHHIDRANEIDTRSHDLLARAAAKRDQFGDANSAKALKIVEHAHDHIEHALGHIAHVEQKIEHARTQLYLSYDQTGLTESDRDHYLGLAEMLLNKAEELLNK